MAAWNGLAISGLCRAGRLLDRPTYVKDAAVVGSLLWRVHLVDGRLRRVSRDGVVGAPAGVLEDYGCVASGFLDLLQATGDPVWLERAGVLLDVALRALRGGRRRLLRHRRRRRGPGGPAARPVGQRVAVRAVLAAARALATYAAITGSGRHRDAAEAALATVSTIAERAPRFAGWSLAAAAAMLDGPVEIAVVGEPGPERDELERRARRHPGAVVVIADAGRTTDPAAGRVGRRWTDDPRRTCVEASSANDR